MPKLVYLIAVILLSTLWGCNSYKQLECTSVQGFKVSKISTAGIDAEVLLTIKNPNRMGFSIYPSAFDITFSGIPLGKARLLKRVHIKSRTEETYTFNISNSFKDISLADVLKLLSAINFKNKLEVKGDLYVGKFFMKRKIPVNLEEKIGNN